MDELLHRLRTFGAYTMDDDGNLSEFHPNPLTSDAADEIERLRAAGDALHAAIRNHDLHGSHLNAWEEARRG